MTNAETQDRKSPGLIQGYRAEIRRLKAQNRRLTEDRDRQKKSRQHWINKHGELEDKNKLLKSAIASDLLDAKLNCGRFNAAKDCSAYTDRGRRCSDCPVDWLHHSEAAASTDHD